MDNFTVLNYQGSKNNLRGFLYRNLRPYLQDGKAVFDIFSGSAAVSNLFRDEYPVYANDAEAYASILARAVLKQAPSDPNLPKEVEEAFPEVWKALSAPVEYFLEEEQKSLEAQDFPGLQALYGVYPTVWNERVSPITGGPLTVEGLREKGGHVLFTTYYASNYYGIRQALEIDCLIRLIHTRFSDWSDSLYACLFYAMKETVFSKDGHMAQPLSPEKNQTKLFTQRGKPVLELFLKKLREHTALRAPRYREENQVFHADFEELLTPERFQNVGLVYADPPYTDMQYSRYYHLLNIAANYDYPALTRTGKGGFTKGLYTEGRYQSKLSQRREAKKSLEKLISFCAETGTNLALSYAYPRDRKTQAVDRYTVSIEELEQLAQKYFTQGRVTVAKQAYSHANHRNSAHKKVLEYLILCGDKDPSQISLQQLKVQLRETGADRTNPMYASHIYWSQKPYTVCAELVEALSNRGEVVFDPFLGSGVTALEAIRDDMGRAAVGCDINDMPLFISRTLLSLNGLSAKDLAALEEFAGRLEKLEAYYDTPCPRCGGTAKTVKTVFDKPERTGKTITVKTVHSVCPCCGKQEKEASPADLTAMTDCPPLVNIQDTGLLANSKLAVAKDDDIRNIFTGRNLAVLDQILGFIKEYDVPVQNVLRYILMSVLHLCKITDKHSNSQWPLWIPRTDCVEKNVVDILARKLRRFQDVLPYMAENYRGAALADAYEQLGPGKYLLMQKGSQNITESDIPGGGVDLIITDPPYLEQVLYSEYMQLYKPFLGLDYNLEDEIVVSTAPSRAKDREEYFRLLEDVFSMCAQKLKQGRSLCLYFHDSSLAVWERLIGILERCGFRFLMQIHIGKSNTLKNIISPKKSLSGDSVLIFSCEAMPIVHAAQESLAEIEENIIGQCRRMVEESGPLSTPELYDNGLMETLIQNGWLGILSQNYPSLVDIFEQHLTWDSQTAKWTL